MKVSIIEINDIETAFEDLSIAIVVQAAKDYRMVLRELENYPFNIYLLIEKVEIEKFFRSQWYECLTTVDGNMILRRLQNGE